MKRRPEAPREPGARADLTSLRQLADAFSAGGHPVALLDREGVVAYMNARFERLIGRGILVQEGRLAAEEATAARALAEALERAVHSDDREAVRESIVLPRRHLRPLVAAVLPVVRRSPDVPHLVAAIVTLTDLDAAGPTPAETLLREAFGLTPAEARLARQLAAGKSLAEIERSEKVARETLRSRLKSIFSKTGTRRQAELTLLLAKLVGP